MKLQARYNRITIISTLFVLVIAAIGYYFLIRYIMIGQLDETLKVEEIEIHDYIKKHNRLPEATVYRNQRISFETTDRPLHRSFKSLPGENEIEPSRQLLFPVEVNGQLFMASVTKSEEATENLVGIILITTTALMILLSAILFLTNRFLFKKLWEPFRATLSSIKAFNLSEPVDIRVQPTRIIEFTELNESIRLMAEKVKNDYESLKNFTDHASHEIQTPLAVINSKLDVLIQEPELNEKSMELIQGIYMAVEKLSRLSQSLLLLTKIENNQYNETHNVSIDALIEEKKSELQEWIRAKNLLVEMQLEPVNASINRELAEILVGNLLNNAIRHSEVNGTIKIDTRHKQLSISNSGTVELDKNRIFDRFYKTEPSDGSGLGLAIVQQICEQYQFTPGYGFSAGLHCFTINF